MGKMKIGGIRDPRSVLSKWMVLPWHCKALVIFIRVVNEATLVVV